MGLCLVGVYTRKTQCDFIANLYGMTGVDNGFEWCIFELDQDTVPFDVQDGGLKICSDMICPKLQEQIALPAINDAFADGMHFLNLKPQNIKVLFVVKVSAMLKVVVYLTLHEQMIVMVVGIGYGAI